MLNKNLISGKKLFAIFLCCSLQFQLSAQKKSPVQNAYSLTLKFIDKDSSFDFQSLKLQKAFVSQPEAYEYLGRLPALLASKGYAAASIDSSWLADSILTAQVYLGTKYSWINIIPRNIDKAALDAAGFLEKEYLNKPVDFNQFKRLQYKLLAFYGNTGYPFASVFLDSIVLNSGDLHALLKVDKGVLYHIDSIRVYGKVNLGKNFLQHYLDISNGSIYSTDKLKLVDKRIQELPYLSTLQPSDISMLGSGSVLNLYVAPRRSSQLNFLIGVLPAAGQTGKLQLTGDVNLDLKNALGTGEGILVKWQQLQIKSPRLNLGYTQPYIFNTVFGSDFLFELFKKDSSFLQVNAQLGIRFALSVQQNAKLFVQWQNNSLLQGAIDTNRIKITKQLPVNIDVSSVNAGLSYEWVNTNYKYNPRKGNEVNLTASTGIKNIKKNNEITGIKDPSFNYASLYDSLKTRSYQLKVKLGAARYFPLGKYSTLKTALHTGIYSSPVIFRNELFQIGGFRLLRGFDEESIYASRFAVLSTEYRNLISQNSYLFFFVDAAAVKNFHQLENIQNSFFSGGMGLVYETKIGLLNISYAVGKRNDVNFNIREGSKFHFGYVNYF